MVQILLDAGADVNTQGGFFSNALQAASVRGHYQVVQILLDAGADVNTQGGFYSNAQAASVQGHYQVVQMLLQKGADVNAQGGEYGNALEAALFYRHERIVLMLLKEGASLELANLDEEKLRRLQEMLKRGTNTEQVDLSKSLQKVQELLKKANVEAQDRRSISSAESSLTSS